MSQSHESVENAVDPAAVLRDDVLVDALAKGVLPMEYRSDELIRALLTWRDDIHSTPFEPTVTDQELMASAEWRSTADDDTRVLSVVYNDFPRRADAPVSAPQQRKAPQESPQVDDDVESDSTPYRRFGWVKRPVLVAASVAAIALGSLGSVAAANVAEPGSPLWPLAKAVNPERAESLEARQDALANLEDARKALQNDDPTIALQHLEQAQSSADSVRGKDGKSDLTRELEQIRKGVATPSPTPSPTTPGPTVSPDPSETTSPTPSPTPSRTPSPSVSPSTTVPTPSAS